jgi:hypothetical protein
VAAFTELAAKAGTTVETMSALDLPARLAGTSLDTVAGAIAKLGKSIGEARLGDVGKSSIFAALGIDANDGRDAAEIMVDVARALSGISDQAVAGKIASQLLGKSYAELRAFMKELAEHGDLVATATKEQSDQAKKFKDELILLHFNSEKLSRQLVEGMLPSLQDVAGAFLESQKSGSEFKDLGEVLGTVVKGLASAALAAGDIFYGLGHQIGAMAAAAAAAASGEFSQALTIIKEADEDTLQHTISTNARIAEIWKEGQAAAQKAAAGGAGGAGAAAKIEAAIREQMEFEKTYQARIAAEQGFATRYGDAIKISNALAQEARKQGLISQTQLIEQIAQNEDALLQTQIVTLAKEEAIYRRKGELAKAEETRQKIQAADAKRIANEAIAGAQITSEIEVFTQKLAFKREVEERDYAQRLAELAAFEATHTDFEDRAQQVRERMAREHRDHLVVIARDEWENRKLFAEFTNRDLMDVNQNLFGNLSQLMQSHSKSQFEIGKAAAIAQAIISTYSSAVKSYDALASIPYAGPYLGAAAAAAAIAAGLMNVANIRAQQFGGSGGGASATYSAIPGTTIPSGSLAPATPLQAPVQAQAAAPRSTINVTLVGNEDSTFTYNQVVNDLLPLIREAAANGADIQIKTA